MFLRSYVVQDNAWCIYKRNKQHFIKTNEKPEADEIVCNEDFDSDMEIRENVETSLSDENETNAPL